MDNNNQPVNTNREDYDKRDLKGFNQDGTLDHAMNDEENRRPTQATDESTNTEASSVEDDIKPLEHGHQKNPGSSGAFPVGAFDTSKE